MGPSGRGLGCLAALAALLVRELSAPWCLVCLVFDVRARGRRAAAVWAAGFADLRRAVRHASEQVLPRMQPGDVAQGARLGPLRRRRLFDLDRADERLAAAGPAVVWRPSIWRSALRGSRRLVDPAGQRIAWGVVLYAVAFSMAGQAIQSILGLAHRSALCAVGCRRAGGSCSRCGKRLAWDALRRLARRRWPPAEGPRSPATCR